MEDALCALRFFFFFSSSLFCTAQRSTWQVSPSSLGLSSRKQRPIPSSQCTYVTCPPSISHPPSTPPSFRDSTPRYRHPPSPAAAYPLPSPTHRRTHAHNLRPCAPSPYPYALGVRRGCTARLHLPDRRSPVGELCYSAPHQGIRPAGDFLGSALNGGQ
jgi:hypothetical protein